MLCGIDLYKLLNYKSNDKYLTIVYSIFIIVFIKGSLLTLNKEVVV